MAHQVKIQEFLEMEEVKNIAEALKDSQQKPVFKPWVKNIYNLYL